MVEENTSKEEMIGFHKGCLSTLVKEREELIKMVNVVEQITQAHINALKELGVDLQEDNSAISSNKSSSKKKMDIEDLL